MANSENYEIFLGDNAITLAIQTAERLASNQSSTATMVSPTPGGQLRAKAIADVKQAKERLAAAEAKLKETTQRVEGYNSENKAREFVESATGAARDAARGALEGGKGPRSGEAVAGFIDSVRQRDEWLAEVNKEQGGAGEIVRAEKEVRDAAADLAMAGLAAALIFTFAGGLDAAPQQDTQTGTSGHSSGSGRDTSHHNGEREGTGGSQGGYDAGQTSQGDLEQDMDEASRTA